MTTSKALALYPVATGTVNQTSPYYADAYLTPKGEIRADKSGAYTLEEVKDALGWHGLELAEILAHRRPSGTPCHEWVVDKLGPALKKLSTHVTRDQYFNVFTHVVDPLTHKIPNRVFTAHTDTVHTAAGTQTIAFDVDKRVLFKDDTTCLGADDGTGVYILLCMIAEGVPGHYAFFADEEIGRAGSEAAHKDPRCVVPWKQIVHVLSFDRKDATSVITHQRSGRCCSEAFAEELCLRINAFMDDPAHLLEPDPTGSYTDSATFMDDIPECTNLSVGYKYQHGPREFQSLDQLDRLIEAYVHLDWDGLPVERDPKAPKPAYSAGTQQSFLNDKPQVKVQKAAATHFEDLLAQDMDRIELAEYLRDHADLAAYVLINQHNITIADMELDAELLMTSTALNTLYEYDFDFSNEDYLL